MSLLTVEAIGNGDAVKIETRGTRILFCGPSGTGKTLSRARLRRQAERCVAEMEPDLSHLTDEQLRGMRELLEPGKLAAPIPADAHYAATQRRNRLGSPCPTHPTSLTSFAAVRLVGSVAEKTKDPRAVELGHRGGLARRNRQTHEERNAIAGLGGLARAAKALLPGRFCG